MLREHLDGDTALLLSEDTVLDLDLVVGILDSDVNTPFSEI